MRSASSSVEAGHSASRRRCCVFVFLARAYVDGGLVVSFDDNVSRWVADTVPGWVEQIARVVTWLGGAIGAGVVTAVALVVLWRATAGARCVVPGGRRRRHHACSSLS